MSFAGTRLFHHVSPVLLLVAACSSDKSSSQANSTQDVTSAYDHLQGVLAECGKSAGQCAQDSDGGTRALQSCRAQEASCRQRAGSDASSGLAAAIQACIDAAKPCAGDGGVSHVEGSCKDALESCLDIRSTGDDEDGGSADAGQSSPVRVCVADLRACVSAEHSAAQCADQVSDCIVASKPAHDTGMPNDAGMSGAPHQPTPDASMSGTAHEPLDAGSSGASHEPPADAGSGGSHEPPADAGMQAPDDCQAVYDACIKGNGSRPVCSRMQRDCQRNNGQ